MPAKKIKELLDDPKLSENVYRTAGFAILLMFLVLLLTVIKRSFAGDIDPEKHVYFEIILLLLLAVLAEAAVFYLKMQSVIVLMVLGMIISPSFVSMLWDGLGAMHLVSPSGPPAIFKHEDIINIFAQLGAIVLLFKVGLHSKIEKIFSRENLLVATAGVIIPFALGLSYAMTFGSSFSYSLFIGAALAATSVGVTVGILKQLNVLDKKYSEVIIGAAVIDDILGLLLLSMVDSLTNAAGDSGTSAIKTFLIAVLFIIGALVSGKYFIEYLDRKGMSEKRFLLALAYMLILAYVAEVSELSAIVGAFLAGIILSKSRHHPFIEEKTYGLELLFMPIFFISLGILVDVRSIILFIGPILGITAVAILSKIIGCGGMSLITRIGMKESLIVGVGMVPRGEVALIIAAIGLSKGVLSQNEYSVLSAMALITSLLVPTMLSYLIRKEQSSLIQESAGESLQTLEKRC